MGKLDINLESVFERLLGDQEMAYLVLFHFQNQIREELELMQGYMGEGDFHNLFERAHALKGSASIAGAEKMYEDLVGIQAGSKAENLELCMKHYNELRSNSLEFLSQLGKIEKYKELYG